MKSPDRTIHEFDQSVAAIRNFAAGVATFYKALRAEGVEREDALDLARLWIIAMTQAHRSPEA